VPASALGLALGAAFLHAVWNLLLRGSRDAEAATAVSVLIFVAVLAPIAAVTWDVDGDVWRVAVPSGLLELAYVALLGAAYRRFELSLVYPVARGLAPVAALVIALVVVRTHFSVAEAVGVLVVAAGVLLVRGASVRGGTAIGVLIACVIGAYTVIDRYGIRHADAPSYALFVMLAAAVAYPPFVGARRVRAALSPVTVAVGVLSAAAYLLVLLALRHASAPAVSAVRETGVVIATVLAAAILREHVTRARFLGAIVVAVGVAVLALS
jgi:drug/metabolite transporter (DMT)-like permease